MSKVSEYLRAIEIHHESLQQRRETVSEFAVTMGRDVSVMVAQFLDAGVVVDPNDEITEADKEKLLTYLREKQKPTGPRIKLSIVPPAARHIRAVAAGENGAEWRVLDEFTESVIFGAEIDPDMQRLVNLLVAKSFLRNAMPSMKRGRPQNEATVRVGREIAQAYLDLRDGGMGYSAAVEKVGACYHKDERHIMRIVEANKDEIGKTAEDRERKRQWNRVMRELFSQSQDGKPYVSPYESIFKSYEPPSELAGTEFNAEDCLEHLEELVQTEAARLSSLT